MANLPTETRRAPVVLVADDDIELRDAMTGILEANGFEVLCASNGDAALKTALSCQVDIVLVDQSMPKKSGSAVHQALREGGFTQPVIIVSGLTDIERLSATLHLRKPFAADELLAAVRQALADEVTVVSPMRHLLLAAENALAAQQQRISYTRHAELRDLCERLKVLDDDIVDWIEEASAPFRQALEHLVDAARRPTGQDDRLRMDLRTILRVFRCILDVAVNPARPPPEHFIARYGEVDLAGFARGACRWFDELAEKRRVFLSVVAPERLVADADEEKLERVLATLLFNAFKHVPLDGAVECRVDYDPREVWLEVRDSGADIPSIQQASLFECSRLSDRAVPLRAGGLVLDLGLSRQLVALQGGTLTVSHRTKEGCGFRATIPRSAPRGVAVSAAPLAGAGELARQVAEIAATELAVERQIGAHLVAGDSRPLVLIVDNSRSIQRVLIECLQPEVSIVSAFDGREGLKLAAQLLPDLIIADERLPGLSGEEMIRQMRANADLLQTPILVLAEESSQVARQAVKDVQDFVRKPFSLPEVRARSARLLAAKRTHDILNEAAGRRDPDVARLAGDVLRRRQTDEAMLKNAHDSQAIAELENRVKSGFLRMMAHELKTPITAMHLQMRLLQRELASSDSPGLRDGMDRITQSSNRLLQLIETCIEWARVESGRCQIATDVFDLAPLVTQVVGEFEHHIRRKGIRVDFAAPDVLPSLSSDRKLARLALLNLINYAVQNTERGTIKVSVESADGCHRVWITDGGAPISEQRRRELFSPFRSDVDLTWQAGSGSGLGLYVVRDIARAIGGDVVLQSTTRTGNTFVLTVSALPQGQARV